MCSTFLASSHDVDDTWRALVALELHIFVRMSHVMPHMCGGGGGVVGVCLWPAQIRPIRRRLRQSADLHQCVKAAAVAVTAVMQRPSLATAQIVAEARLSFEER